MVGQNQNWERSDQPKAQLTKTCNLNRFKPNLLTWILGWSLSLPVLILRGPRWIFVWSIFLGDLRRATHP